MSSDWLNEVWSNREDVTDDYCFVYMGPAGTWSASLLIPLSSPLSPIPHFMLTSSLVPLFSPIPYSMLTPFLQDPIPC